MQSLSSSFFFHLFGLSFPASFPNGNTRPPISSPSIKMALSRVLQRAYQPNSAPLMILE